jgi:hypothetical protein
VITALLAAAVFVLAGASPAPTASPQPAEIGHVKAASGRATNLVGTATAASEGTVDQAQIGNRPILRPAEVLEAIPGLVVSQHSGEGKANQYYLRGFQLDHGTDLAATIAGIPINMPSHAHGQGYSDINWLMPELVAFVTFKKGPYYADEGDFSTAGSYDVYYRNTIAPVASIGFGDYGYDRLFVAGSPAFGRGNLLYALEAYHDNGTLERPDQYKKLNGVVRWSKMSAASSFVITAQAYRGDFNSSDQVPQRLVDSGQLDRFGSIDPTDGGRTFRYALSIEWERRDRHGTTKFSAYAVSSGLNLYSNFTYFFDDAADFFNVTANPVTCSALYAPCKNALAAYAGPRVSFAPYCPANAVPTNGATIAGSVPVTPAQFAFACGDQREQEDKRFTSGFRLTRSLAAGRSTSEFGIGLRNDNIYTLGLYLTKDQIPFANGILSQDRVVESDVMAWASTEYRAGQKLRLSGGLRLDAYSFRVHDAQPANSGTSSAALVSPTFTAAYALTAHQEVYLDFGASFHSNDGRGTTQTLDPRTHAAFDTTGAPVQRFSPLVRAWGEEAGYRFSTPRFTSTVSFWKLNIASELVFNGDAGTTTPSGPTVRTGIELTNFFRVTPELTIDTDVATASARFLTDPDNQGTFVPESLNVVTSAGITLDRPRFAVSVRYRYFGPRVLDQAGDAVSSPTSLVNLQLSLKNRNGARIILDVFNLLNGTGNDVQYFYSSWLPSDARNSVYAGNPAVNPSLGGSGVGDYHFHPTESRVLRLIYSRPL